MTEAAPAARILVVARDDEMSTRLRQSLEGAGYEVELAADALAAVAQVEARRPQLALVDLGLPRREGWTSLLRLRALPDAPPVVVLVARADYRAFAQAIREGAAAYRVPALRARRPSRPRAGRPRAGGRAAAGRTCAATSGASWPRR